MTFAAHAPVLMKEAIDALAPMAKGVYVDATFGGGGYTREILARADCRVFAFDRDPTAVVRAKDWAGAFGDRLTIINKPFADMAQGLDAFDTTFIDGAVFDLGVSSMQLDEAERGFSFMRDGPLSMRMDGGKPDAADVVNNAEPGDLAAIFSAYGEERRAGRIARAIVEERKSAPIETTARLADIVKRASPPMRPDRIHPATRVFQALRIFVNDELGQLANALVAAERLLRPAGRLVVVTFHSLEDRIVKRFFIERSGASAAPSRHAPMGRDEVAPTFSLLHAKPVAPSPSEIDANPRARSAKLRAAIRTEAHADDFDAASLLPRLSLSRSAYTWR